MKVRLHRRPSPKRAGAGFTLLEVCAGLFILGVFVTSLYAVVNSGFASVQLERENMRATQILVEKMDTLRLYSWDQITDPSFIPNTFTATFDPTTLTNAGTITVVNGNSTNKVVNGKGGNSKSTATDVVYYGTVNLATGPADSTYGTNMMTATVTVTWNSGTSGAARTRKFETFVTKNGLQNYIY